MNHSTMTGDVCNKHALPTLCFGVLLVLAGCTIGPFSGQAGPASLVVENADTTTHTFEVSVVDGVLNDKEVIIRKRDGDIDWASPGPGVSTYKLDDDYGYVTSITLPPNRTRLHHRYILRPGEKTRSSISDFKTGSTVVVVVYRGDQIVSLVAAECGGGNFAYVEVAMRSYGTDSAYICEGGLG